MHPLEAMNVYFGTLGKTATQGGVNPYHYGHLVEVKVDAKGKTIVTKHYAMGGWPSSSATSCRTARWSI